MLTHFADREIKYTGKELCSHWIYRQFDLRDDAIVAFIGPCEVALESMVDLADVVAGDSIFATSMLHFIVERFDTDLEKMVLLQRLLVAQAAEIINCQSQSFVVSREGDDLYAQDRKLSVSIATVSPVSTLIHFALNIDPTGAPVPAIGLSLLGIDPSDLAKTLMKRFAAEVETMRVARCKVRAVE